MARHLTDNNVVLRPDKSGPCSSLSIKSCWNFGGLASGSGHADWLRCPLWIPGPFEPPVGSTRCQEGLQGFCLQGRPVALSWHVSDSDPGKRVSPSGCMFILQDRVNSDHGKGADMLVSDDSQVGKRSSLGVWNVMVHWQSWARVRCQVPASALPVQPGPDGGDTSSLQESMSAVKSHGTGTLLNDLRSKFHSLLTMWFWACYLTPVRLIFLIIKMGRWGFFFKKIIIKWDNV